MSLTARDCPNCTYSVFADDEHDCIVEGREVNHPQQFPVTAHWAILIYNAHLTPGVQKAYQGAPRTEYRAYFSDQKWKNKIRELTNEKVLFTAFKASKPAEITTQVSVNIDVN